MDPASAVDPVDTRRFFEAKESRRREALEARFAAATADAASIAAMIARDHPRVRVWQWGSLLDRRRFSEISDIDIAVEGFEGDAAAWSALLAAAEGMTTFPLDIVRLERIEPLHAASIRSHGRLVHEGP